MHKLIYTILVTLILLSCICAGLLGTSLFTFIPKLTFALWQSMGSPPQKAIKFLEIRVIDKSSHAVDVYVETASQKVYCYCDKSKKWEETHLPENNYFKDYYALGNLYQPPKFNNLSGKVIDAASIFWVREWLYVSTTFVILDDGSVWQWLDSQSDFVIMFYISLFSTYAVVVTMIFQYQKIKTLISGVKRTLTKRS